MFSTCIPLPQITQDLSNLPPEELKPNVTEGDICWIKWVVFTVSLGQGPEKLKGAKAAVAFLNGGVGILSSLLSTSCCIHSKLVFKAVHFLLSTAVGVEEVLSSSREIDCGLGQALALVLVARSGAGDSDLATHFRRDCRSKQRIPLEFLSYIFVLISLWLWHYLWSSHSIVFCFRGTIFKWWKQFYDPSAFTGHIWALKSESVSRSVVSDSLQSPGL